jgi:poly(A) polymerase
MSPKAIRAAIYRVGGRAFADRAKLAWAAGGEPWGPWGAVLDIAQAWTAPALPVTGQDALEAGLTKGPAVGDALRQVEAWWIDQDFPADRDLALDRLRRVARSTG